MNVCHGGSGRCAYCGVLPFMRFCARLLSAGWIVATSLVSLVFKARCVTPAVLAAAVARTTACPPALMPPAFPASRRTLSAEGAWELICTPFPLVVRSSSDESMRTSWKPVLLSWSGSAIVVCGVVDGAAWVEYVLSVVIAGCVFVVMCVAG